MHRRVPVVAAVEGRRQLARGLDVGVALEDVRDLVRVLLVDARERERREPLGGGLVDRWGLSGREHEDEREDAHAIPPESRAPEAPVASPVRASRSSTFASTRSHEYSSST